MIYSLAFQGLRLHASKAGGTGSIPGRGTKIPHAAWCGQKKKRKKSIILKINLFIFYFWLCWVFVAVHRLSLVAASGGYSSLWSAGFSLQWLLFLRRTGSRCTGFSSCGTWAQQLWHMGSVVVAHGLQSAGLVVVAHGLSCSAACGIFLDQGSNLCHLHWQADS